MTENGPAELAGLRVGDKLVAVNGMSCVDVDHYEAVDILKAAGPSLVVHFIREVTRLIPPVSADQHDQEAEVEERSTEPEQETTYHNQEPPKPAPRLSIGSSSSLPPEVKEMERPVTNGAPNPAPRLSFTQQQAAAAAAAAAVAAATNNHVHSNRDDSRPASSQSQNSAYPTTSTSPRPSYPSSSTVYSPPRPSSQPPPPPTPPGSTYSKSPSSTSTITPPKTNENGLELRKERVYITLLRDHTGLGFSVSGGKGGDPYKDGTDVSVLFFLGFLFQIFHFFSLLGRLRVEDDGTWPS